MFAVVIDKDVIAASVYVVEELVSVPQAVLNVLYTVYILLSSVSVTYLFKINPNAPILSVEEYILSAPLRAFAAKAV